MLNLPDEGQRSTDPPPGPAPLPDIPLVYVSGRYRADSFLEIMKNIAGAWADAAEIWRMGAGAICPHMNTAGFSEIFGENALISGEQCIQGDLVMIHRCDAIYMREGWRESKGANVELRFAASHAIPIYFSLTALAQDVKDPPLGQRASLSPLSEFEPVQLKGKTTSVDHFVATHTATPCAPDVPESPEAPGPPNTPADSEEPLDGQYLSPGSRHPYQYTANPKDAAGCAKTPFHLVPESATRLEAEVMRLGAIKYGPYNWRKTRVNASVYISALRRHMALWFDGEDYDPESGLSHLAHARANLGILLDAQECETLNDDRPLPVPPPETHYDSEATD